MSKRTRRGRRSFTDEFKAEAIGLARSSGQSVGRIAQDLDLTETAPREWVRKADADDLVQDTFVRALERPPRKARRAVAPLVGGGGDGSRARFPATASAPLLPRSAAAIADRNWHSILATRKLTAIH